MAAGRGIREPARLRRARGGLHAARVPAGRHRPDRRAISVLNYLAFYGDAGLGADSRPLPPVAAVVSMSGATPTRAAAPIRFQTSDFDGSPALVGPTVLGVNLGNPDPTAEPEGIGYHTIKRRYDLLRESGEGASPLSLVSSRAESTPTTSPLR